MTLFLQLLLAHFLGDFVFQSEKWVKNKEKKKIKSPKLYIHIALHLVLLIGCLGFQVKYLLATLFITISHYFIDLGKLYIQTKKNKAILFFIDQLLHILMIAIVVFWYHPIRIHLPSIITQNSLLFICCLLFVSFVSSIIIRVIISQWNPEKDEKKEDQSLAKAGKYIGILERLFVFTFIVLGRWEGIGFLLAAKSVFRFGDLTSAKDRKLTEYILIGTLLSFGLAIFAGLIFKKLLQ